MTLPRFSHRALPVEPPGEGQVENERRYRAEVERAFQQGDLSLMQIERRLVALEEAIIRIDAILVEHDQRLKASYDVVTAADIVVTDAWQPLVLNRPPQGLLAGAYEMTFMSVAAGTNATAELQFRTAGVESKNLLIGNNTLAVTRNVIIPQGVLIGSVDVRGVATTLTNLKLSFVRIGSN